MKAPDRVLDALGTGMFWALCLIVFLQVIFRFVLKIPSPWTEEVARYLLVEITFLGSAIATRDDSHLVAMNPFAKAPRSVRIATRLVIQLAVLYFAWVVLRGAVRMVEIAGTETATSLLWLRMSYVYAGMTISLALVVLYALMDIVRQIALEFAPTRPRAKEGRP